METDEDETQITDAVLSLSRVPLQTEKDRARRQDCSLIQDPFCAPAHITPPAVGRLLGLLEKGSVPLVSVAGAPHQAGLRAKSTVDLHGAHVGREVLLIFESGDPSKPVIVGVLRNAGSNEPQPTLGHLEISVDGERMLVTAKTELVFRCGKSQLTLRQDGRIEISGETVVTKANGANRILGGSIQLN